MVIIFLNRVGQAISRNWKINALLNRMITKLAT